MTQHHIANRQYRLLRINSAETNCAGPTAKCFLAATIFVGRDHWLRPIRTSTQAAGYHFWFKAYDGLRWLGKIAASTYTSDFFLVHFFDDRGPTKVILRLDFYTTAVAAQCGSWCLRSYTSTSSVGTVLRNTGDPLCSAFGPSLLFLGGLVRFFSSSGFPDVTTFFAWFRDCLMFSSLNFLASLGTISWYGKGPISTTHPLHVSGISLLRLVLFFRHLLILQLCFLFCSTTRVPPSVWSFQGAIFFHFEFLQIAFASLFFLDICIFQVKALPLTCFNASLATVSYCCSWFLSRPWHPRFAYLPLPPLFLS